MITDDTNLRAAHKRAVIIAAAIMGSLFIYAGVAEFFLKDLSVGELSVYSYLRYLLVAVAAVVVIAMVFLKNIILSGKMKLNTGSKTFSEETKENEFIQRLFTSFLITFALCESIAFFGFILFIVGKNKTEFYAFLGVAFFLMMVNFPKYEDWKSRLEDFLGDY
jgi:F0F1-type ATP synthase membrane subunit c/vacuolar-type H+-ATPase subunit K